MTQITLDGADVGPSVDQRVAATVTQHVRVDFQVLQAGSFCSLPYHEVDRDPRERLSSLGDKERVAIGRRIHFLTFDQPGADRLTLALVDPVWTGLPSVKTADAKKLSLHVDVEESNIAKLADPQPVASDDLQTLWKNLVYRSRLG